MGKNEDMAELTSLEKVGKDCWKFRAKYNASFDAVFESLKKARVFDARTLHTLGEFEYDYYIDDQGIWLLSHCFSNWTEMYAQATKKSPWEESWQKKQEQLICDYCEEKILLVYKFCPECQHYFHTKCYYEHIGEEVPEQGEVSEQDEMTCAACGVDGFNDLVFCRECNGGNGRWLCSPCYANPTHIHSPAYKEKQRTGFKRCPECGMEYSIASRTQWVTCPDCKQTVCLLCYGNHRAGRHFGQSFSARQGHASWNIRVDPEMVRRAFEAGGVNLDEARKRAEEAAKATAERMRREQEAKDKARAEREKKEQEEFFRNFWNTGSFFNEDYTDAFRAHFTGQQSQSNSQQSQQKTRTQAPSSELEKAFKLLNLSQRATVQEVKRAFKRMALQGEYRHPDKGGEHAKFVKLNNAYEVALAHAERNER